MTKYEKSIYEIIRTSHEHLTVCQIFQKLRENCPNVVQATVYNNLNRLWKDGFVRKVSVEGMPDRYDIIQKHDHLICRNCGRISDISLNDLTGSLRDQLGQDFLFYDLKVYYLCPACRKKNLPDE